MSMRRALAVAGRGLAALALGGAFAALPAAAAAAAPGPPSVLAATHGHHHGHHRPPPWPACPHGHPRQDYPPRGCHAETDRTSVSPGGRLQVYGGGFRPFETVVITMPGLPQPLQTAHANADGAVLTAATVPRDVPAGAHVLTLTAAGSGNEVRTLVTVRPLAASSPAGTQVGSDAKLPFAGAAAAIPLAAGAMAMVLAGGLTLLNVRRRRTPHPHGGPR